MQANDEQQCLHVRNEKLSKYHQARYFLRFIRELFIAPLQSFALR